MHLIKAGGGARHLGIKLRAVSSQHCVGEERVGSRLHQLVAGLQPANCPKTTTQSIRSRGPSVCNQLSSISRCLLVFVSQYRPGARNVSASTLFRLCSSQSMLDGPLFRIFKASLPCCGPAICVWTDLKYHCLRVLKIPRSPCLMPFFYTFFPLCLSLFCLSNFWAGLGWLRPDSASALENDSDE